MCKESYIKASLVLVTGLVTSSEPLAQGRITCVCESASSHLHIQSYLGSRKTISVNRFWTSGDGQAGTGFRLTYIWTDKSCGGFITSKAGVITSKSNDRFLDCTWVIPNVKSHKVRLIWTELDLVSCPDCDCNFVEVVAVHGKKQVTWGRWATVTNKSSRN